MKTAPEGQLMLDAVSATGASSEFILDNPSTHHTVSVEMVDDDAGISALSVALEGRLSQDSGWLTVATHNFYASELSAKGAIFAVVNRPLRRVRVNITTLTGAGVGDSVTVYYQDGGRT